MKAKALLALPLVDIVRQVDTWADLIAGDTPDGQPREDADPAAVEEFDEFVLDFTDNVLLPFPEGSTIERITDTVLAMGGDAVIGTLRQNALEKVRIVTEWAPLAGFAEKLPG